jgi:hypothetical protein
MGRAKRAPSKHAIGVRILFCGSVRKGIDPMRIGLLADIHEDVEGLAAAISTCHQNGVDRLLTLGDIFETGERFAEAVDLLRDAEVGNRARPSNYHHNRRTEL